MKQASPGPFSFTSAASAAPVLSPLAQKTTGAPAATKVRTQAAARDDDDFIGVAHIRRPMARQHPTHESRSHFAGVVSRRTNAHESEPAICSGDRSLGINVN